MLLVQAVQFCTRSKTAKWYNSSVVSKHLFEGTCADQGGRKFVPGPMLGHPFARRPEGEQVASAFKGKGDNGLLAWNSPIAPQAKARSCEKPADAETVYLPVQVERGEGTVRIPHTNSEADSGKIKYTTYQLPVEPDDTIRRMRRAFMEKAGVLTRASLNLRVGLQSCVRSQVDWDFCSSNHHVPVGPDLETRAAAVVEKMRAVCWAEPDLGPSAEDAGAWAQMMGLYLTGVVPFGRYLIPETAQQAKAIADNWKLAASKRNEQQATQEVGGPKKKRSRTRW